MPAFSAFGFVNADTTSVTLNSTTLPVQQIGWRYEMEGSEQPNIQDAGVKNGHWYVRRMVITMTGKIIGSSASAYWTQRAALLNGLLVDEGTQGDTAFKHGRLSVTPSGGSSMYADVVVLSLDLPAQAVDANTSEWTAVMLCNFGYWRATSGDAVVKL